LAEPFSAAAMRVSALRHRVAGEALPGLGDAASFAKKTALQARELGQK
jgi:hypothetical protein